MDLASELVGAAPAGDDVRVTGTGVALYVERAGGQFEEAIVAVEDDGWIVATAGAGPHGQGH